MNSKVETTKRTRTVVAILEVDDNRAIKEYMGTIDYLETKFGWLEDSGIYLNNARILDDDDEYDTKAIQAMNIIFEEKEN